MRRMVDPSTFAEKFEATPAEMKLFGSRDFETLLTGLQVRIRSASQGMRRPRLKGPGPGEYATKPSLATNAPRWQPDAFHMAPVDIAAKILPGPGAYTPQKPRRGVREWTFSARQVDLTRDTPRHPRPGPSNYVLPSVNESPRFTMGSRDPLERAKLATQHGPSPCQYLPKPSDFDPRPGNAASSPRFPHFTAVAPGPGYYDVPAMEPVQMAFSPTRRQHH